MKPWKLARKSAFTITSLYLIFATSQAHGHEFILKPSKFQAQPRGKIPFSVLASHAFMVSAEMEPVHTVKAWLYEDGTQTSIPLRENPRAKVLEGEVRLTAKGTAILVAHLEEPIEIHPPDSAQPGAKIKREKWSKVLLSGGAPDKGHEKLLGHKLEIVPLSDPLRLKAGDELSIRILLDGKPLNAMVFATYDGFSRHHNTYAYATESRDGIAHIKFLQRGVWMIRVENCRQVAQKDFNQYVLKAALIFPVQ